VHTTVCSYLSPGSTWTDKSLAEGSSSRCLHLSRPYTTQTILTDLALTLHSPHPPLPGFVQVPDGVRQRPSTRPAFYTHDSFLLLLCSSNDFSLPPRPPLLSVKIPLSCYCSVSFPPPSSTVVRVDTRASMLCHALSYVLFFPFPIRSYVTGPSPLSSEPFVHSSAPVARPTRRRLPRPRESGLGTPDPLPKSIPSDDAKRLFLPRHVHFSPLCFFLLMSFVVHTWVNLHPEPLSPSPGFCPDKLTPLSYKVTALHTRAR